jgi:Zn-dependent protease with chaperone function
MNDLAKISQELSSTSEGIEQSVSIKPRLKIWQQLRGGFFLVFGYLLSPLCWWNDLLFNLPIAYFFGYLCSFFSPKLLFPCTIIGYWLSNIIGILLMQFGSVDIFQKEPKERNLKKELLNTLVSSTVYTLVIMFLIQLKIIDIPISLINKS